SDSARSPSVEATVTMRPRLACSAGSAARTTAAVPSRFTCTTRSHSAPGTSTIRPQASVPAAATTASRPSPASARTASSAARVSARSTTTAGASARAGTASVRGSTRSSRSGAPPAAATAAATARPRPDAAPVTSTRPSGRTVRGSTAAYWSVVVSMVVSMVVTGVPPWSGGGERGVFPVGLGGGGQRRLDGAAQHVDGGEVGLLHGRGVARDADRVVAQPGEGVGAGPGERPHLRAARPGGLRRGEQVGAAAAGGQQDQHVAGAGVRADLPGVHLPEPVVVADRGERRRVGVQGDRGQRTAFALEAAHELRGEVLRLGRAPAVARDEQPVAVGEPVGQRAAPAGERVTGGA